MLVAEVSGLRYFFLLQLLRFVIVLRTPPNQIPSTARSDSERRPIRFRPPPDQIPNAARSDCGRYTATMAHELVLRRPETPATREGIVRNMTQKKEATELLFV